MVGAVLVDGFIAGAIVGSCGGPWRYARGGHRRIVVCVLSAGPAGWHAQDVLLEFRPMSVKTKELLLWHSPRLTRATFCPPLRGLMLRSDCSRGQTIRRLLRAQNSELSSICSTATKHRSIWLSLVSSRDSRSTIRNSLSRVLIEP